MNRSAGTMNLKRCLADSGLYVMLLPGVAYVGLFCIVPMIGVLIAFKDFNMFIASTPLLSIFKSDWVGLKHFTQLFARSDFLFAFRNTVLISLYKLVFLFPIPIIFALLLNEIEHDSFKKLVQQVVYLPNFISWAVLGGIFVSLLGNDGMINNLLEAFGFERISFLMDKRVFRSVLVVTDGWKTFGWGSIVYLAAITAVDQEVYEAAIVDGANRLQRVVHVTLPGIAPTIVLMLILRVGGILDAGFGQIFVMYSPIVYEVSDIIGTYVYRIGLGKLDFGLGTAVGLFNSVITFGLVLSSNYLARKWTGKGIW